MTSHIAIQPKYNFDSRCLRVLQCCRLCTAIAYWITTPAAALGEANTGGLFGAKNNDPKSSVLNSPDEAKSCDAPFNASDKRRISLEHDAVN
jgi:hypothetical protein